MRFDVTILGCGSALPASGRHPSSQVVNVHERLYMVDCGEGTQERIRQNHIRLQRLGHIFISHLHGDHYLGLMGLISSLNLLGREKPIHIYGPPGLKEIVDLQLKLSRSHLRFEVRFFETSTDGVEELLDTADLTVSSIPLRHRIPTTGFIFREKRAKPNMSKAAILKYSIGVRDIHRIKEGADLTLDDGRTIPNSELTIAPPRPRAYAYLSDTAYVAENVVHLAEVDLLYHEATFEEKEIERARQTRHSTAAQAAMIANEANVGRLLIGHFSARYPDERTLLKEAKAVFDNTLAAKEGMCYRL